MRDLEQEQFRQFCQAYEMKTETTANTIEEATKDRPT